MDNILKNCEVRELSEYNCYAIMHQANNAIIYDGNYRWKTKREAQKILDDWQQLPDKLHRRNMQIKDLKEENHQLKLWIEDIRQNIIKAGFKPSDFVTFDK